MSVERRPHTAQQVTQAMCNAVVARWALRSPQGQVVSHTGRVCYPDAISAQGAAMAMRLIPGAEGFVLRRCGDHWHLTTRLPDSEDEGADDQLVVLDSERAA